ncbi:MAG: thiamine-phosphate kinase [Desulfatiglandaceae bacterium]
MGKNVGEIGEFGLIAKIREWLSAARDASRPAGPEIGDDCAVFMPPPGHEILLTCDTLVEGRHYLPSLIRPYDLGRRAMVQNISDIGAMGGLPLYALVSLGLRPETQVSEVEDMYSGFLSELSRLDASIIGGNITSVETGRFIDITVVGSVPQGRAVTRRGARPGDAVLVTGFPGESGAALRLFQANRRDDAVAGELSDSYLCPVHRALEGRAVADQGYAGAMIDTSDGMAADLGHICSESRVGARIYSENLPVRPCLRRAAELLNCEPVDLVLGTSDDYELLITCPPEHAGEVADTVSAVSGVPVALIGTVTAENETIVLVTDSKEHILETPGWDHFRL